MVLIENVLAIRDGVEFADVYVLSVDCYVITSVEKEGIIGDLDATVVRTSLVERQNFTIRMQAGVLSSPLTVRDLVEMAA